MSEDIYTPGDWIVHAHYGVGQVKGKDKRTLDGKKQTFLRVKTFSGEYFLPIQQWNVPHIRPLCSEYQFKKALTIIKKTPEPLPKDYKKRNKKIVKAASDISIYTRAKIIRDLNGRRRAGKLNLNEKDSFETIKDQFLIEWSVVTGRDKEELRTRLDTALQNSFKKLINVKDKSWLEKVRKGVKAKRKPQNIS
ncbi:MAG: hypothetical protein JW757_06310 [Anaerolineales bacterium]|nr:hypothetical protein [Anaerolineales bacterium]